MTGAAAVSGLEGGCGASETDERFRVAGAEGRGRRRGEQSAARTRKKGDTDMWVLHGVGRKNHGARMVYIRVL
jgi:hypothetical protein